MCTLCEKMDTQKLGMPGLCGSRVLEPVQNCHWGFVCTRQDFISFACDRAVVKIAVDAAICASMHAQLSHSY